MFLKSLAHVQLMMEVLLGLTIVPTTVLAGMLFTPRSRVNIQGNNDIIRTIMITETKEILSIKYVPKFEHNNGYWHLRFFHALAIKHST